MGNMMYDAEVQVFFHNGSCLTYRVYGDGPATLVALHGFGQTGTVFVPWLALGSHYTVLSIDLFLHGSDYAAPGRDDNGLLTKTDWQRLLGALLRERNVARFTLAGFSLGGRFALAAAEAFADRLDGLLLIAPDGITQNFWYRLATCSRIGRGLFQYVLRHLPALKWFGRGLVRLGLLNPTAMRFAEVSLQTPQQRQLVYDTWVSFRRIRPDLDAVAMAMEQHAVRVRFFTGACDRIVPNHYILPLANRLREYEITTFSAGHHPLIRLTAEALAAEPAV